MRSSYEFDVVVTGGGAAGLTAAGIAANFGAKTMMIESGRLGGDCTWTGCIPSKTLLKSAKVAHQVRRAGDYGLTDSTPRIDFPSVMEHLRKIREKVYEEADRPEIFEEMGIEVLFGRAEFRGTHRLSVALRDGGSREITSRYFLICTGGRPAVPPIDGLNEVDYLTSESLFEMDKKPSSLVVIGAGPIGTEMAQAMNRLGVEVAVVEMAGRIMANDHPELADRLRSILQREGITYHLNAGVKKAEQSGDTISLEIEQGGSTKSISGDALLLAAGRTPNTGGLNLEAAGVACSSSGIEVDDRCRTGAKHIYACGDVTGRYQFTHMSEHMAKVAATNALLKLPVKIDKDHVPWVTYTDPELAHVGKTEQYLQENEYSFETYRFPYSKVDRAITESEEEGEIRVYAKKWSGKILGADVLGAHAGEIISEYALAMKNGVTLRDIADTIHPYPSYGLAARRAADQWYIKNQKEWIVKLLKKIFGYRGEVPDYSDPDRIV